MTPRKWVGLAGQFLAVALVMPVACNDDAAGGGTAGSAGSAADSGADSGSDSSVVPDVAEDTSVLDTGIGADVADDVAGCATETVTADRAPLDMYLLLDESESMIEPAGVTPTKWAQVAGAIGAFMQAPESAGIGAGVQFFPIQPDQCETQTYNPPAVAIAELPGNKPAISAAIAAQTPFGGTPTRPAMEAAVDYTTGWAQDNPTHVVVIVLATDGLPTVCDSTIDSVAQLAASAAGSSEQILTFVIGVGDELANLNQIAEAGGTNEAIIVDASQDITQGFLTALNSIRQQSVPCEYVIPATSDGGVVDPQRVNVTYVSGAGDSVPFFGVGDEDGCVNAPDAGWYYDDPDAPTKIILCPGTCEVVKTDSAATVHVVFGCETIVK